jgi:capsular exopolysaccharide synthesis family protein
MSRIQNILDKAERDGAVHRLRVLDEANRSPAPMEPAIVVTSPPIDLPGAVAPVSAAVTARPARGARLHPLLVAATTGAATAEQYRALRTRILHADTGTAVNVVLVTSPGRGEGKSLTVASLGLSMAQEFQRRTCVVDANLRDPHLHRLFGIDASPGLADVLVGGALLEEAFFELDQYHLTVLPAGNAPAHPAELLGTTAMRRVLETLRSRFDCVVIDAPAAAPLADVGVLTPLVDSVLMVVRAGCTPKPAIHDAVAALDDGKLLGIILNDTAA